MSPAPRQFRIAGKPMRSHPIAFAIFLGFIAASLVSAHGQDPSQKPPDFQYFFTAADAAFEGYLDHANQAADADGNKLATVKLMKFSASFRAWIKSNFPGGEAADYAIDAYSIDCQTRKVGEHTITWYDAGGNELTDYDFGGTMSTPISYSMKENLMKKLCGLP